MISNDLALALHIEDPDRHCPALIILQKSVTQNNAWQDPHQAYDQKHTESETSEQSSFNDSLQSP